MTDTGVTDDPIATIQEGCKRFGWLMNRKQLVSTVATDVANESMENAAEAMGHLSLCLDAAKDVVQAHANHFLDLRRCLQVKSVEHGVVEFEVSWWDDNGDHQCKTISFQVKSGRWRRTNGGLTSSARVASEIGVSAEFLNGVAEAVRANGEIVEAISDSNFLTIRGEQKAKELRGHRSVGRVLDQLRESHPEFTESCVYRLVEQCLVDSKFLQDHEDIDFSDKSVRIARVNQSIAARSAATCTGYPDVPPAKCIAEQVVLSRLDFPAVYFKWSKGIVDYVGKASSLCKRLSSHHIIGRRDEVSWIPFPEGVKDYAELYYIGLLRPALNAGGKWADRMAGVAQ